MSESKTTPRTKYQPKTLNITKEQANEFLKNTEYNPITKRKILKHGRVYKLWIKSISIMYPDLIIKNEDTSKGSMYSTQLIGLSEDRLNQSDLVSIASMKNVLVKTNKRFVYTGEYNMDGYILQGPYTSKNIKRLNDLMFIQECCYTMEIPILSTDIIQDCKHHYWIRSSNHFHGTIFEMNDIETIELFEKIMFDNYVYYYILFLYCFGFDGLEQLYWIENEQCCYIQSFDPFIEIKESKEFQSIWDVFSKTPTKKVTTWLKEIVYKHRDNLITFLDELLYNYNRYEHILFKYSFPFHEIKTRIEKVKIVIEWY